MTITAGSGTGALVSITEKVTLIAVESGEYQDSFVFIFGKSGLSSDVT